MICSQLLLKHSREKGFFSEALSQLFLIFSTNTFHVLLLLGQQTDQSYDGTPRTGHHKFLSLEGLLVGARDISMRTQSCPGLCLDN